MSYTFSYRCRCHGENLRNHCLLFLGSSVRTIFLTLKSGFVASILLQLSTGDAVGLAGWEKESIPSAIEGRVVTLAAGEDIYIYGDSTCQIYSPRNSVWRPCPLADSGHPFTVGRGFAVADGQDGHIYMLDSSGVFLGYQKENGHYKELEPPPFRPGRGARLVSGADGFLFAVKGIFSGQPQDSRFLYRYEIETQSWSKLGRLEVVNLPGKYSSGLVRWNGGLFVWGDHHVARYDVAKKDWSKVFYVLRYRPSLEQGGMHALYPDAGKIFYTLGRDSNSLGVLSLDGKRFDYLRPRLPVFVSGDDETLFVAETDAGPSLYFLSPTDQALYSIPLESLEAIEASSPDKSADLGSIWEIHNVGRRGAQGDLVRSIDSFTNAVHVPPYVYYQRKNILRRLNLRTRSSSPNGQFLFHDRFITAGAAFAYDDNGSLYLFTGHDRRFFRVDIGEMQNGEAGSGGLLAHRKIEDLGAVVLAELPVQPGTSTSLVEHKGGIWAAFASDVSSLYRFDISKNRWFKMAKIPELESSSESGGGLILYSAGGELYLFRGSGLYKYVADKNFDLIVRFPFEVSADGGMATYDPISEMFYVALGGGRRGMALVDPASGEVVMLADMFPDVVSVAGQRMWIHDGELYIWRGHDSAEIWKASVKDVRDALVEDSR